MTNTEKGKDLTTAVDKRDYLVKLGLAKEGRGKFSNAAKEALIAAEKNGIVFLDKNKAVATVVVIDENGDRKQEQREVNPWAHHPEPIRTNDTYTFVGEGDKKTRTVAQISVATACESCRFSLGWCYCETPTVRYWKTGEVLRLA